MTQDEKIAFEEQARILLNEIVTDALSRDSKVFILTDTNTQQWCYPVFAEKIDGLTAHMIPITIPSGEINKTLESVSYIWKQLTTHQAGRDAVLINLGGGMISDIGGFAASCFKRGIRTIHIPTSLLSMIDASIGGKTAIDFMWYKNLIGTFYPAESILIFPEFLNSLPLPQIRSGLGEIIKYSLISDPDLLTFLPPKQHIAAITTDLLRACIHVKQQITLQDPKEKGLRKVLNFGHTAGHAIESYFLEEADAVTHGEAVAAGVLVALWLSVTVVGLSKEILKDYQDLYLQYFVPLEFASESIPDIVERMRHDKKNLGEETRFVLLRSPGQPVIDQTINPTLIEQALHYYLSIKYRYHGDTKNQ